jgi:hypothetical protein
LQRGLPAESLGLFGECPTFWILIDVQFPSQLQTTTVDTTYQTMQCLGCDGIFKTEKGMIRHLSKKVFFQKAMGVAVSLIHPPTMMIPN